MVNGAMCLTECHKNIDRAQSMFWNKDNHNTCAHEAPWSVASRLHGQRTTAFSWHPMLRPIPRRPTNSGSTLTRAAHLEGGVISCHQCLHLVLGKCGSTTRNATPGIVPHAYHPPPPSLPHQTHHSHDQLHTCTNYD